MGGGKNDEYFEVDSLSVNASSEDCILPSEDANVTDMKAESSSRGSLKGTSSRKRKNIVVEKCSYVPATFVDTSNPSKRLRLINVVDQFNDEIAKRNSKVIAWMSDLQRNLSSSIGNSNVDGCPNSFKSSNWSQSNKNVTRDVELVKNKNKISRKIKESREKRERQWRKLLHMQLEDKLNLEKEIENKEADFVLGYKIELLLSQKFDVLTKEKLNDSNIEHHRRFAEMKRKHEVCLKDLETKQLETRQKFREILN
ncbi:hypothetical protein TSUD_364580 [Trifolium subterraneum]|uniref:Uncharacterized protein n=1 Tax=Trifolium subterraneum TaxID=3900 RepID=A0A2Z6N086_TRISU|nr:hypothetical protein TSUD_364580 [Trifolium subterraneum]